MAARAEKAAKWAAARLGSAQNLGHASYLVRVAKASWRKRHDLRRVPTKGPNKAPIESWIKRAIELVEAENPRVRGKIDKDDVKSGSNLKSSVDAVEYVHDHLPEAKRKMMELASK